MLYGPCVTRPVGLSSPEWQIGGLRNIVARRKALANEVKGPLRMIPCQLAQYGAVSFGIERATTVPRF